MVKWYNSYSLGECEYQIRSKCSLITPNVERDNSREKCEVYVCVCVCLCRDEKLRVGKSECVAEKKNIWARKIYLSTIRKRTIE